MKWEMGAKADGSDSIAVQVSAASPSSRFRCILAPFTRFEYNVFKQVAPESHWPELVALVCVVNANKKAVSSTSGMMNRWAGKLSRHAFRSRVTCLVASKRARCSRIAQLLSFPTA